MKLKTKVNGQNSILSTISLSSNEKGKKNIIKKDISKNIYNNSLTLLLNKEKEKANSTTQTGQKSLIYSNEENTIYSSPKTLYETVYNSENRKNIFKKNSKLFLLNDKLYSRNEINGKLFFHYENDKKNNNDTNLDINNLKTHKPNKLSLIDICYNSKIINNYKRNSYHSNYINNNLDMYHYYDLNQRRIEKIIPNINEYLNNNTNKKKHFKINYIKLKSNKDKNMNLNSPNSLNLPNRNNFIQYTFNNFNHKHKKYYLNKNNKNRNFDESKNNTNNFDDLVLFNSMNNCSLLDNRRLTMNNKINKRDFSCKVPHRKRNKKIEFEKMKINIGKKKKMSIGIINYLSSPN